jgi:hypothetical protein
MKTIALIITIILCVTVRATLAAAPQISLTPTVEENKKSIQATVTLDGKPLQNVIVQFLVKRTFGNLLIGQDTTLDDGTALVAFPANLPGGTDGTLIVTAAIKVPAQYVSTSAPLEMSGAAIVNPTANEFTRALWAPRAPIALLVTIFILLAGVWSCYAFVAGQILAIRKGG